MSQEEERLTILASKIEAHTTALINICLQLQNVALTCGLQQTAVQVEGLIQHLKLLREK